MARGCPRWRSRICSTAPGSPGTQAAEGGDVVSGGTGGPAELLFECLHARGGPRSREHRGETGRSRLSTDGGRGGQGGADIRVVRAFSRFSVCNGDVTLAPGWANAGRGHAHAQEQRLPCSEALQRSPPNDGFEKSSIGRESEIWAAQGYLPSTQQVARGCQRRCGAWLAHDRPAGVPAAMNAQGPETQREYFLKAAANANVPGAAFMGAACMGAAALQISSRRYG